MQNVLLTVGAIKRKIKNIYIYILVSLNRESLLCGELYNYNGK